MIVNGRVSVDALVRFTQVLFRKGELAQLVIDPAERIEEGAVLRIKVHSLANHRESFREPDTAIGQHVAKVVQNGGVLRVDIEGLAELCLSFVVPLLAVVEGAAQESDVKLLVGFGGQGLGTGQLCGGILPALQADVDLSERK